ncbi:hypothetical protein Scep_005559 [Stephania cephalantha]|uniref:RRM domain-containing protein n=1 Tax=Stephania cephalantha TaxID=152367 RepID=A0AAP0KX61_9MAGN
MLGESKDLQDGPLPKPLDLPVHPASEHEPEHLEIAHEGPNWVPERRGDVALHEEMAVPGESVPENGNEEDDPPSEEDGRDEDEQSEPSRDLSNRITPPLRFREGKIRSWTPNRHLSGLVLRLPIKMVRVSILLIVDLCLILEGQGTLALAHPTRAIDDLFRARCQGQEADQGKFLSFYIPVVSLDSSDVENPGDNLYVTGLSPRITKREIEKHFSSEGGKVVDVHLVVDPWTRESRGFGFVTMSSVSEADRCIKYLDGSVLEGRVITVEKARRSRGRTPTPGRYLGLKTTLRMRRRSPSYSPYSRDRCSSSEREGRSYSPSSSRGRYRSRSESYSRSPVRRRYQSYSRSYSPSDRSVSPYYRRDNRSITPHGRRQSRQYRYYLRHDRSVSPYYRRHRDRSESPYYGREMYYSRRHEKSVSTSVSRSVSPRSRRSARRSYSRSVSRSPASVRSYSRSASSRYRESSRSPSPSASAGRESRSRSKSRSYSE